MQYITKGYRLWCNYQTISIIEQRLSNKNELSEFLYMQYQLKSDLLRKIAYNENYENSCQKSTNSIESFLVQLNCNIIKTDSTLYLLPKVSDRFF